MVGHVGFLGTSGSGPGGGGGPDARRFGERLRRTTRDYKAKQERLRALRG